MIKEQPVRTPPGDRVDSTSEMSTELVSRLGDLQVQFDRLKAQVRQAQQLSSLGTAAATIAHEVNNLLTPILGYAKTALDTGDSKLQRKALEVTVRHAHMLVSMTDHILEISAAKPAQREPVSVRGVVNDAIASLCRDLSKDGIKLRIDVDERLTVRADPLQFQQVLFNLFLNAREAMAPNHSGRLTVSGELRGDRFVLAVNSTGDPIPPDRIERIFEPFETTKQAPRKGRQRCGGLGLALCRDLIEENAGTITVTSTPESGTTFAIDLPAGDAGS